MAELERGIMTGPRVCVLSNGTYAVMLSENGGGYSRWRDLLVTRWREDPTRDHWGSFLLLRDEVGGTVWSATPQPFGGVGDSVATSLDDGCAVFTRREGFIESTLRVAVAADADIELRQLTVTNVGDTARTLSVTSYAELILGSSGSDSAHPAFSKLFVHTEWEAQHRVLLATRRKGAKGDAEIWAAHAMQIEGQSELRAIEHETDRARFVGRCRTLGTALAMEPGSELSNTIGTVLDPIFSFRQHITVASGASTTILLWTQLADSRAGALALTAQLGHPGAAEELFVGAARHADAVRERLHVTSMHTEQFSPWLSAVLYSNPRQRPSAELLTRGSGGPQTLWPAGISGDRPIMLLRIGQPVALHHVDSVLLAQRYWRSSGMAVDVVLLNTAADTRGDTLHDSLTARIAAQQTWLADGTATLKTDAFVLRAAAISNELRDGLLAAARVCVDAGDAEPAALIGAVPEPRVVNVGTRIPVATLAVQDPSATAEPLEFSNGHGGFSDSGRTYSIDLHDERGTPAPWVNVIANPAFGFLVSAEGGGYTWSINSQQNPITPWPNDPVSDSPHEVLYVRDEDSAALWSATALPIRVPDARYDARHGKGYSHFTSNAHGIDLELTMCVPSSDSVKLSRLRLCNRSTMTRRLSVTGYVEWALGANGSTPAPSVITTRDEQTGAMFARNAWRRDFGGRVAFIDLGGRQQSMTGDRLEFLGPLGAVGAPAVLRNAGPLSGRVGAGLDPCGALQAQIELPPDTQFDVVFMLGDAASEDEARTLIAAYRATAFDTVLAEVESQWRQLLDTVQIRTPNRAMDIMVNEWLPYQTLSCRVWGRTAYYQASGAYGFRDQLQDVMALCVSRPDIARAHLLRAAGRQFAEGDVQHWWLPPSGEGIRTRIADDRVWLAYVVAHYVTVSGDANVLDEDVAFLAGPAVAADATSAMFRPTVSERTASAYEHCALGLDAGLTRGAHGLPLIGTGDWNDGLNNVGAEGRGESVWLGWMLLSTINAFLPLAEERGDRERAYRWRQYADALQGALDEAWDGEWYRRGYYDDGTPLGSRESEECQIDSIAQSWSVMAASANRGRAEEAMVSVDRLLVDHEHKLARLFTPPFDRSAADPGYIKGYPPGIRENGGQYTHGATWLIFAWAGLGNGHRVAAMFDLLNPIRHSDTEASAALYRVEPYVACGDVYSVAPHVGRGGWTWYTGTAAWLYRAGLEAILGFQLRGDRLRIDPCIPPDWPAFQLTYQRRAPLHAVTTYDITVDNASGTGRGVMSIVLDGTKLVGVDAVPLAHDGNVHTVCVTLGAPSAR